MVKKEDAFDGSDKKIVNSQQDRALARRNIAALRNLLDGSPPRDRLESRASNEGFTIMEKVPSRASAG